jgi:hypothetical protein
MKQNRPFLKRGLSGVTSKDTAVSKLHSAMRFMKKHPKQFPVVRNEVNQGASLSCCLAFAAA